MATQASSRPRKTIRPSTVPPSSFSQIDSPTTIAEMSSHGHPASAGMNTTSRRRRINTASPGTTEGEEEDFGWPALPPILQFRSGMARENVGRGVDYVLPVDKGRLSMENVYRVDLRAMFQIPYMQVSRIFDDVRINAVTGHHLRPNTIHSPDRRDVSRLITSFAHKANDDVQLRKVSSSLPLAPKRAVENYCNISPDNRPLFTPDRMQTRSKLYLPFNAGAAPSSVSGEARAKAESILRELDICQDFLRENDAEAELEGEKETGKRKGTPVAMREATPEDGERNATRSRRGRETQRPLTRLKNAGISCYDDIKIKGATFRLEMPSDARSPFLDAETNAKIWQWLTDTEVMTDFDYFMVLCG